MLEKKKLNPTIIALIVLLALAVLYIAYGQYADYKLNKQTALQQQLNLAYQQGVADTQERTLLGVIDFVKQNGNIMITDRRTNQTMTLVPYQEPQQPAAGGPSGALASAAAEES